MSECNVCLSMDVCDYADDFAESAVLASVAPFKCCECARQFHAGALVQLAYLRYGDDTTEYETCSDCVEIHKALSCDGDRLFGDLWESIEDAVFPDMTLACIAKVKTASARAYLQDEWRKWKR